MNKVIKFSKRNFKLFFEYVYFNLSHLYLNQKNHGYKNTSVLIPQNLLYYSTFHMRFSSVFYSSQLVDMFAYELPLSNSQSTDASTLNSVVVYNFHNLAFHERFFLFCANSSAQFTSSTLSSVSEIYPNANWLEREVSELHGEIFQGKKDLRNLMLQYGDVSVPFQKAYPSAGFKETFYDAVNDLIVQAPTTLQA